MFSAHGRCCQLPGSQGLGRSEGDPWQERTQSVQSWTWTVKTPWWTLRLCQIGPLGDSFMM